MNKKKIILTSVFAAIIFNFVSIGYFGSQISAVYPPIKKYDCLLTMDEFTNKMIEISNADSNLKYKITDTTGTSKDDLHYYVDVHLIKNSTLYTFNFFYNKPGKKNPTINLVGAFDNTHKFGGYKNNNTDMEKLIAIFESDFIDRINN